MKFSNIAATLLSATAVQASSKSNEPECTHLILANSKSGSTAAARAICHALQQSGGAACIHEPIRVAYEQEMMGKNEVIQYGNAPTVLCKDMVFHIDQPMKYMNMLLNAIKPIENPVVFLKSNPIDSFVSLLKIRLKETANKLDATGNNKIAIHDEDSLNAFVDKHLLTIGLEVAGGRTCYDNIKRSVIEMGKEVIEINSDKFPEFPRQELNKVMDSWNKTQIAENATLKMSAVKYLDGPQRTNNNPANSSYQMTTDLWDTVKGEVFSPPKKAPDLERKLKPLMDEFVHESVQEQFFIGFRSVVMTIEKLTDSKNQAIDREL